MHIIDHKTPQVLVGITSNCPLYISWCYQLGHIVDIAFNSCFLADTWTTFDLASFPLTTLLFLDLSTRPDLAPGDAFMETQPNNVMRVYRDSAAVEVIFKLVAEYFSIWEFESFVWIFSKRWIRVLLISDWEFKVSTIKPQVYFLGNNFQYFIDKTFDKMH